MEVAHKLSITEGVEIPDNLAELMEKENA